MPTRANGEGIARKKTSDTFASKRDELKTLAIKACDRNGVPDRFADRHRFLMDNDISDATARRILNGKSAGGENAWDKLRELAGAVAADPEPDHAASILKAGIEAKRSTLQSLKALFEEVTRDPADAKLIAMMLAMFRDA